MVKIINNDCLDGLKELSENSVDSIVTDPPYGLSFMGKHWDYDVPQAEIWRECLRVLKPGGHLLSFFGTRTYHRGVVQIEDAGFEIRDQIGWVYGSGFPKSHNLKGDWQGWGTALKPAWEPICVARKPLEGTVANNVLKYRTGGLNIEACKVGTEKRVNQAAGNKPGTNSLNMSVVGMPQNVAAKECIGRWPANLIHDGSEEVVGLFPECKTGNLNKVNTGIWGNCGERKGINHKGSSGSAARFFYCAKASRKDREEGCEALPEKQYSHDGREKPIDSAYQRNNNSNHHPTVKPTDLMRYLVRLVTPPGGVVLDPFMGSGSTGKAAVLEGFGFIGMEREAEYCQIAEKRIAAANQKKETLF